MKKKMAMFSSEFNRCFQKFPNLCSHFKGAFAIDDWPKTLAVNDFFISNTAKKDHEG